MDQDVIDRGVPATVHVFVPIPVPVSCVALVFWNPPGGIDEVLIELHRVLLLQDGQNIGNRLAVNVVPGSEFAVIIIHVAQNDWQITLTFQLDGNIPHRVGLGFALLFPRLIIRTSQEMQANQSDFVVSDIELAVVILADRLFGVPGFSFPLVSRDVFALRIDPS